MKERVRSYFYGGDSLDFDLFVKMWVLLAEDEFMLAELNYSLAASIVAAPVSGNAGTGEFAASSCVGLTC